jgi:transposase
MGKDVRELAGAEGARRATEASAGRGRGGRFSVGRKTEAVLRLLRGEDLELVSRELGLTAARLSQWREQFLAGGQANLKARDSDPQAEESQRLQAKVGELLMENELLYAKVDALEGGRPLTRRRSRR